MFNAETKMLIEISDIVNSSIYYIRYDGNKSFFFFGFLFIYFVCMTAAESILKFSRICRQKQIDVLCIAVSKGFNLFLKRYLRVKFFSVLTLLRWQLLKMRLECQSHIVSTVFDEFYGCRQLPVTVTQNACITDMLASRRSVNIVCQWLLEGNAHYTRITHIYKYTNNI